jgi:rubredoxin---NAD+ reductase
MSEGRAVPLVVIGSGIGGYTLVRQLRALDKTRPVIVLTADGGEAYSKPMLSNALAKAQTPEKLVQKTASQKAVELDCEVRPRCIVKAIDADANVLDTSDGPIAYSQLVLATGAHQRRIIPAGAQADWLHTVNSLEDFRKWYPSLAPGRRVLLIGAGLIGCEFADDLMTHGLKVTLVDPAPWPLPRLLPQALGLALQRALIARGAQLELGRQVARLDRGDDDGFVATLDDGRALQIDLVLSAVGLVPETALAKSAGLDCQIGIRVDRQLRTSHPDIFAIGDCAQTAAGLLPYIQPVLAQARCLAEVLAGNPAQLTMKAMPVLVKTTSLPLVVCPPPPGAPGEWVVQGEGGDLEALFNSPAGDCIGFALTGAAVKQQQRLVQAMPALLAD